MQTLNGHVFEFQTPFVVTTFLPKTDPSQKASLAFEQIITKDSLSQMTRWRKFSGGWNANKASYGMGLLSFPLHQTLANGSDTNVTFLVGHPGADWGSRIMVVGHYPHLNASIAIATNSAGGLNFSKAALSRDRNSPGEFIAKCHIEDRLLQFLRPGFPHLNCPSF